MIQQDFQSRGKKSKSFKKKWKKKTGIMFMWSVMKGNNRKNNFSNLTNTNFKMLNQVLKS